MNKAEKYTKSMLDEISRSSFSSHSFQIKRGRRTEVVDEDDAIAHWLIQPKASDTSQDLAIIHRHNHAVLETLRGRGIDVQQMPELE